MRSLVALLQARAQRDPDRVVYRFLSNGEQESDRLSFGELHDRAMAVATLLQESGAAGQRVLLMYPPGLEFVIGFFGCLYAGAIAVPVAPEREERLGPILRDCSPRVALTTAPT